MKSKPSLSVPRANTTFARRISCFSENRVLRRLRPQRGRAPSCSMKRGFCPLQRVCGFQCEARLPCHLPRKLPFVRPSASRRIPPQRLFVTSSAGVRRFVSICEDSVIISMTAVLILCCLITGESLCHHAGTFYKALPPSVQASLLSHRQKRRARIWQHPRQLRSPARVVISV